MRPRRAFGSARAAGAASERFGKEVCWSSSSAYALCSHSPSFCSSPRSWPPTASAAPSSRTAPTTRAASATSCRRGRTASTTCQQVLDFQSLERAPAALRRPAAALRKPGLRRADADRRSRSRTTSRTRPSAFPPGEVESTIEPKPGVTILRDKAYGVPHIYGDTRADTMFGAGYAGANDRLFLMDVLRHTGRAELASFLGGSQRRRRRQPVGLRAVHRSRSGKADHRRCRSRTTARPASRRSKTSTGLRRRHQRLHRRRQPQPETEAGRVRAAQQADRTVEADRRDRDRLADRRHLRPRRRQRAELGADDAGLRRTDGRARPGRKAWEGFRSKNDPEAPTTISKPFPYETRSAFAKRGLALPEPGTRLRNRRSPTASGAGGDRRGPEHGRRPAARAALEEAGHASNWELVSAKQLGRPATRSR